MKYTLVQGITSGLDEDKSAGWRRLEFNLREIWEGETHSVGLVPQAHSTLLASASERFEIRRAGFVTESLTSREHDEPKK